MVCLQVCPYVNTVIGHNVTNIPKKFSWFDNNSFFILLFNNCAVFVYSVLDSLKRTDMAVFCVDENSELVTFSESKLGQVSVLMCNWLRSEVHPFI